MLVRCASSGLVALGAPVGFPDAVCLSPAINRAAAQGTWSPAENRALCACLWPLPSQRRWVRSASYPFGVPRSGCPWRVPQASVLSCVRCGDLRVWTLSLTGRDKT